MEWRLSGSGLPEEEIFTTGDAAKVCKISQQTIIRCFDEGLLRGFRVPGSSFRRIPQGELMRFVRENGIGVSAFNNDLLLVIASLEEEVRERFLEQAGHLLRQHEPQPEGYLIDSPFDAGAALQKRIIAYPMEREALVIVDEQSQCHKRIAALLAQRERVRLRILNHKKNVRFVDALLQAIAEETTSNGMDQRKDEPTALPISASSS